MSKVRVNDIEIHYQVEGEGEPLLFIHGLGSSLLDWEEQVSYFSKRYKVITLDLRGHGKTSKPKGPYSIHLFADDVAGLLKALEIDSTHIVGLSMGSATGFHLAINYPEVVKTLVVSNMSASVPVKTFAERKQYYFRLLIVKMLGMKKMGEVLGPKIFVKPEHQHLRDLLAERWAKNDKKAYLSSLNALKNWSVLDDLHRITCPTLVIHAENDYSSLELKKDYTSLIPKARLEIIEDAGHAVSMEKPQEYNTLIKTFLEANS